MSFLGAIWTNRWASLLGHEEGLGWGAAPSDSHGRGAAGRVPGAAAGRRGWLAERRASSVGRRSRASVGRELWRQTQVGRGVESRWAHSHSEFRVWWRQGVSQIDASLLKVWEGSLQTFCLAKPGLSRGLGPGSLCAGPKIFAPIPAARRGPGSWIGLDQALRLLSVCLG